MCALSRSRATLHTRSRMSDMSNSRVLRRRNHPYPAGVQRSRRSSPSVHSRRARGECTYDLPDRKNNSRERPRDDPAAVASSTMSALHLSGSNAAALPHTLQVPTCKWKGNGALRAPRTTPSVDAPTLIGTMLTHECTATRFVVKCVLVQHRLLWASESVRRPRCAGTSCHAAAILVAFALRRVVTVWSVCITSRFARCTINRCSGPKRG